MKTNRSYKKPSASIIWLVVIIVFSIIAGGKIFNQSGNNDLRTAPQETRPYSTPAVTASAVAEPLTVPAASHSKREMQLSISCRCLSNDHVGQEWVPFFFINCTRVHDRDKITLEEGQTIVIYTEIAEYDKDYIDSGSDIYTRQITAADLMNMPPIKQTIEVEENGGQYKGHIAVWEVTFTFSH